MNQESLSSKQSLDIITEMITISRKKIIDNGMHFILWGVLIALCSFIQFFMLLFQYMPQESNLVWLILPIVGTPMSFIIGKKQNEETQVKSILTEIYKKIWLGFGISLFLIIFISIQYHHSPTAFILILMGFAMFLSYLILNFRPMLYGAVVFFVSSVLYIFIKESAFQALFYGISVVLGYLIPGVLLYNKFKHQRNA